MGNRSKARVALNLADLDAKTIRRKGDKSKTGIIAISRHSERLAKKLTNNNILETKKSYPSPEFLNSLSFIKKFYPLPVGAREKFTKGSHENSCNSRHSEAHSQSAKWLQKTRRSAGLFCNYVGTFNANENSSSERI